MNRGAVPLVILLAVAIVAVGGWYYLSRQKISGGVSICDLQNDPALFQAKAVRTQGTVSKTFDGHVRFYLEDHGCKIQVAAWAPLEVICGPGGCGGRPDMMPDYIGKRVTLEGRMAQNIGPDATQYVFSGKLL